MSGDINFKDNLLAQFSVVTLVIMVILALLVSFVLIKILNNNIALLKEHNLALIAGKSISLEDPISLTSLSGQINNLKWIASGAIIGSFVYLYITLVYLVWEGWKTIVRQRGELQTANAELETRVADRVEDLRNAVEVGGRRLEAFRTAAGRLALEEDPGKALQELVSVARDLVGARYASLALMGAPAPGRLVTSGFSAAQRASMSRGTGRLSDLGLSDDGADGIVVHDADRLLRAHGLTGEGAYTDGFLGVRVNARGRSTGVLYLMEKEGDSGFDADDERLLNLFSVLT